MGFQIMKRLWVVVSEGMIYKTISCQFLFSFVVLFLFSVCCVPSANAELILGDREFIPTEQRNYALAALSAEVADDVYRNDFTHLKHNGFANPSIVDFKNLPELQQLLNDANNASNAVGFIGANALSASNNDDFAEKLAKASMQAVVGWKWINYGGKKKRLVSITFRGTEGFEKNGLIDWAINATAVPVPWNSIDPYNKVHKGFFTCAKLFDANAQNVVFTEGTEQVSLKDMLEEAQADKAIIWISGHSLGGAIATLYGARLIDPAFGKISRNNVVVYTFGAPSVGNASFRNIFWDSGTGKCLILHRTREKRDIVPYASYLALLNDPETASDVLAVLMSGGASPTADFNLLARTTTLLVNYSFHKWPYEHIGYPYGYDNKVVMQPNELTLTSEGFSFLFDELTKTCQVRGQQQATFCHHNMQFEYMPATMIDLEANGRISIAAPDLKASIPNGTYYTPQSVSFTSTNPRTAIYLSVDGSAPEYSDLKTSSAVFGAIGGSYRYDGPINISGSITIKAIVVDVDGNTSNIHTFAFNVLKDPTSTPYLEIQAPATVRADSKIGPDGRAQLKLTQTDKIRLFSRNDTSFANFNALTGTISVLLVDQNDKDYYVPGTLLSDGGVEFSSTSSMSSASYYHVLTVFDNQKHLAPGYPVQQVVEMTSTATSSGGGTGTGGDVTNGLVAHWTFDDCTASDVSGNGNNGTFVGNPQCVDGVRGKALSFSGTDFIEVPDSTSLKLTTNFTISMWVNQSATQSGGYRLIDKGTPSEPGGYSFDTYDNGNPGRRMRLTLDRSTFSNDVYSLNQWHHLVVTFNNGLATYYLDGVQDGSSVQSTTAASENNLTLLIGAYRGPYYPNGIFYGTYFKGYLDDISIYNRALADTEVQQLYGNQSGLVANWSFDDCTATDVSGNGNNGTKIGTTCVDGVNGKALSFNGTSDYIEVPTSPSLNLTNTFTISLWAKQVGAQQKGYGLIGKITPGISDGYAFDTYGNSISGRRMRLSGAQGGGTSYDLGNTYANTDYSLNVWHHLVVTFNNGISTFYLDGQYDGTGNHGSSHVEINSLPLRIGSYNSTTTAIYKFNGLLDDIIIYDRTLSNSEVQSLYNNGYTELQKKLTTATFLSENLPDGSYQVGSATKSWRFKSGANAITGLKAVQVSGKTSSGLGITQTEIAIGDVAANSEFLVNLPINPVHDATSSKSSYWSFVDGTGAVVTITNSASGQFWLKVKTNRPPTFSQLQLDSVAGQLNTQVQLPIIASDPDGDTLTYSVISGGGSIVNGAWQGKSAILYQNTFATSGVQPVTIKIDDGHGDSAQYTIQAVITPDGRVSRFFTDVPYPTDSANNKQQYDQYLAIHNLVLNGIAIGRPDPNDANARVFEGGNIAKQAEALALVMKAASLRNILDLDADPRDLPNLTIVDAPNGIYENFSWAAPYVLKAEDLGLIDNADTFNPAAPATRAWLASLVSRMLKLDPPLDAINPATYIFADASAFATTDDYDNARAMAFFGYMGSFGSSYNFNPNDSMIRADVAMVTSRILQAPTLDGLIAAGLTDQTIYGRTLPSVIHGQSFTVTGLSNLNAHAILDNGGSISDDWLNSPQDYVKVMVIRPGIGIVARDVMAKDLATAPVTVPTVSPDISASESRDLLVLVEDTTSGVRAIARIEYGVIFPDADGDGVRDDLDLWPNNPLYSTSTSGNGLPDNANALWNLGARNSTDIVNINGVTMTLLNAVLQGNIAGDTTPPVTTPSIPAGSYSAVQSIALNVNETATIYYTTDGSIPTTASSVYATPLVIGTDTVIKFFAVDVAGNRETVKQASYAISFCGTANNGTFIVAPTANLCAIGTATTVTGSGPWSWTCIGTDGGTIATCSAVFDTAGPDLTLSTLADNSTTNNPTLNVAGTVNDSGSGVKSLTVNGRTATITNGAFSVAVTLADGPNTITTIAIDNANNTTTDIRTITLDRTAPSLIVTLPADNGITGKGTVEITGSVDDANATVTTKVNNGAAASASKNGLNFSAALNLAPGLNTIDITATDLAGNSSSAKRSITSDVTAPTLAVTLPAQDINTTQSSIIISGTVTDAVTSATVGITADGQTYAPAVTAGGSFIQTINLPTAKTYAVVVIATDQAGNKTTVQRNIVKVMAGDINGDGIVDIRDALKVLRIAVGLDIATADNYIRADVAPLKDGKPSPDGTIDIADAVVILGKVVGLVNW